MVKIADIAETVGVSPATVSRALNGKGGVSEKIRAQIVAEAARLHFVANGAARSLATTRTENIAFAIYQPPLTADEFFGPFYSRIMFGAEKELQLHEHHLLVSTLTDEHIMHPEQWGVARGGRVDGVIVAGPLIPARFIVGLSTLSLPVVVVDNALPTAAVDTVLGDDYGGARRMAEHVLEHGHQRIVIIAGPTEWVTNRKRCAGYLDALREVHIEPLAVLHADATTHDTGAALMQQALAWHPTAVLAINDAMAFGAIDVAQAAGLAVPEDLVVTGFDDIEPAQHNRVPLTTVHLPKRTLGRVAARQLLSRIEQPQAPHQRILLETTPVLRRSCGCQVSTP